jgi:hypothetical protein
MLLFLSAEDRGGRGARASRISADFQRNIWRYIAEEENIYRCENLKPYRENVITPPEAETHHSTAK